MRRHVILALYCKPSHWDTAGYVFNSLSPFQTVSLETVAIDSSVQRYLVIERSTNTERMRIL